MPRRRLSPEERELWRRVAVTTVPIRSEPQHPASPPDPEPNTPPQGADRSRVAGPPPGVVRPRNETPLTARPVSTGRVTFDLAPDPHVALDLARLHMDRRRFDKMRRGRLEPEARLDLHGMTSERAHAALRSFIAAAHAGGLRLVLVITGKGRPGEVDAMAPQRHGVLRHGVPHWLAAPPLASKVLQIAPAHLRHGGGGAYYVYLRRQR